MDVNYAGDFTSLEVEPTTPLQTLSPSAIKTFLGCPERFRRSYLKREWEPMGAALLLGRAYHHARQHNYEQKIWSGEDLPVRDVLQAFHAGWERELNHDVKWKKTDKPEMLRQIGAQMTEVYHRQISPTVHPVAVEERFHVEIPGVGVPFVGRVDVRTAEGRILDTKTSTKPKTEPEAEWRIQAMGYMAALPAYDFAWHVQTKDKGFPVNTPATHPKLLMVNTPSRRAAAALLVRTVWTQVSALYAEYGVDEPWSGAGLSGFSCRICPFWSTCPYWT